MRIDPSTWSSPTEGYEFTYLCSIVLTYDLEATPELVWVGPDGNRVKNGSSIAVGQAVTDALTTSLALKYMPLNTTHGGKYSCEANVYITKLNRALFKEVETTLVVTSKSERTVQKLIQR